VALEEFLVEFDGVDDESDDLDNHCRATKRGVSWSAGWPNIRRHQQHGVGNTFTRACKSYVNLTISVTASQSEQGTAICLVMHFSGTVALYALK